MKSIGLIITILALALVGNSELGIDLSTLTSADSFKCFLEHNYTFVSVRAWRSFGSVDPNAGQTLKNAQAAGYKAQDTGIYMFPCSNNEAKPAKEGPPPFHCKTGQAQ